MTQWGHRVWRTQGRCLALGSPAEGEALFCSAVGCLLSPACMNSLEIKGCVYGVGRNRGSDSRGSEQGENSVREHWRGDRRKWRPLSSPSPFCVLCCHSLFLSTAGMYAWLCPRENLREVLGWPLSWNCFSPIIVISVCKGIRPGDVSVSAPAAAKFKSCPVPLPH